jgi:hypothetical protein
VSVSGALSTSLKVTAMTTPVQKHSSDIEVFLLLMQTA